jgi:hypothetical protein
MNQEMKMTDKCSSCGQPIPITEPDCPNCGRKIKISTATDLYWIKKDGDTSGPFTFPQVQGMWKAGTVKVTDQIMRDGKGIETNELFARIHVAFVFSWRLFI